MLSLQKKLFFSLFSLLTPQFFIQKLYKHPTCKMNRDEKGGAGRKFEVLSKHSLLFERPQSLFAATKIYILIFNLTHFLISLMG